MAWSAPRSAVDSYWARWIGGQLGAFGPRVPFWFAAGMSAVAFLYGLFVLPESLPRERRMAFSWARANPSAR